MKKVSKTTVELQSVSFFPYFQFSIFIPQGQGRKSNQNAPSVAVPKSHDFAPPFTDLRLMP
jgi:hypothetical protein